MPQLWPRTWSHSPSIGLRWILLPRPQSRSQWGECTRRHGPRQIRVPFATCFYLKLSYSSDIIFITGCHSIGSKVGSIFWSNILLRRQPEVLHQISRLKFWPRCWPIEAWAKTIVRYQGWGQQCYLEAKLKPQFRNPKVWPRCQRKPHFGFKCEVMEGHGRNRGPEQGQC